MKILIVVDMQNDFITGPLGTPEAQAIVPNVKARTEDNEFDMIFYTKDTHTSDYLNTFEGKKLPVVHCIENTEGWQIIPELQKDEQIFENRSYFIEKPTFGSEELVSIILQFAHDYPIEKIELCGVCTDICVISNALMIRTALPETYITVKADCCAGVTPELHEAALKVMESCQINVVRKCTKM
ncbi:MAG: cysteine hydrolase family protein [Candidatus Gastranaerophilaceae bacterium]